MATITKNWTTGNGSVTLTYTGGGNGTISISADANEGVDRSMTLAVKTADNKVSKSLTINQTGKRDYFDGASNGGHFTCTDGEFLVLK